MKIIKLSIVVTLTLISTVLFLAFKNDDLGIIENSSVAGKTVDDSTFNSYWYSDKAEIRTYDLTQARYGEYRKGVATLIFVTEPFSKKHGLKPDIATGSNDQVPVFKFNFLKKFGTGIYPYSMMLSTFTSINNKQNLLKATVSGQEWCGQIFSQMNKKGNSYKVVSYSYFEEEKDQNCSLPSLFTEDEIWSQIRINYLTLPQGNIKTIPGLFYTRLEQHPLKPENATANLKLAQHTGTYSITYPERDRTLSITFDIQFPHEIIKWEESYADKRGSQKILTTTAILNKSMNIDYWNYNKRKDRGLRDSLQLLY